MIVHLHHHLSSCAFLGSREGASASPNGGPSDQPRVEKAPELCGGKGGVPQGRHPRHAGRHDD